MRRAGTIGLVSAVGLGLALFAWATGGQRGATPAPGTRAASVASETPAPASDLDGAERTPLSVPRTTISGRVTHEDGLPARDVQIAVHAESGEGSWELRSNADGSYSVNVPEGDEVYEVWLYDANQAFGRQDVPAGASGVDFVIQRAATLYLRCIDHDTGDLASRLDLHWRGRGQQWLSPINHASQETLGAEVWQRIQLPEGPVDLWVLDGRRGSSREGLLYRPVVVEDLLLRSQAPERVVVELERGLTAHIVMDPRDNWLPRGSKVYLVEEGLELADQPSWIQETRRVVFEVDGSRSVAMVRGLAPGRYRLVAEKYSFEPALVELRPDATDPLVVSWSFRD